MTARWAVALLLLLACGLCRAGDGAVGDRYDTLKAGGRTFQKVEVRQITPQGLIIFHSRGISQVPFEKLTAELRAKYGYDAQAEAAYLAERERREAEVKAASPAPTPQQTGTGNLIDQFETAPEWREEVDLRAEFYALDLYIKDQGRRPSCAVFAVVSALEFENAKAAGTKEKLSEEYLIWATRKTLGIPGVADPDYDPNRDGDLGFSLLEVVQALRRYGIPEADDMPNTFGKSMAKINEPDEALIKNARERREVTATYLTGRNNRVRIDKIVHALNQGLPVVIGLNWPHEATIRSAPLLSKQTPQSAHAVTLVGYKCESGKPENARFLFKNSWGPDWGIRGHGWITYEYLKKNLSSAVILDVR